MVSECPSSSMKLEEGSIVKFPFTQTDYLLIAVLSYGRLFRTLIESVLSTFAMLSSRISLQDLRPRRVKSVRGGLIANL